jgi:hypothetical protein
MMARSYASEALSINHGLNGRYGGVDAWLEFCIDQSADWLPPPPSANSDERALPLMRLYQDERAVGLQVLPGLLEGMDHALVCDSSKRPAEESDVEMAAADAQSFGRANTECDVADALRRSCAPGLCNPRWIRLDRHHV